MNQKDEIALQTLSGRYYFVKVVPIAITISAIYLMAALFSFNPLDSSWSQTTSGPIHNLGGRLGAWLADTLLFTFGISAFAVPPIIMILCWAECRQHDSRPYIDYLSLSLRLIGALALIFASCGLAAMNVDDFYYFVSGGVIGSLFSRSILSQLETISATLTLLGVWAVGFTLFTGWSWLMVAEKIGGATLSGITMIINRFYRRPPLDEALFVVNIEKTQQNDKEPGAILRQTVADQHSGCDTESYRQEESAQQEDEHISPSAKLHQTSVPLQQSSHTQVNIEPSSMPNKQPAETSNILTLPSAAKRVNSRPREALLTPSPQQEVHVPSHHEVSAPRSE